AQVEHARRNQRPDQFRRPLLRDRDQLDRRFSPARAARGRRDPASNRYHIPANSIAGFAQVCTLDDAPSGKTTPRGVVTTAVAPTHGVTKPPRLTILHDVRARKSMRFPAPVTHSRLSGLANRNESGGRLILDFPCEVGSYHEGSAHWTRSAV